MPKNMEITSGEKMAPSAEVADKKIGQAALYDARPDSETGSSKRTLYKIVPKQDLSPEGQKKELVSEIMAKERSCCDRVLEMASLVWKATGDENDEYVQLAYQFVDQTMQKVCKLRGINPPPDGFIPSAPIARNNNAEK